MSEDKTKENVKQNQDSSSEEENRIDLNKAEKFNSSDTSIVSSSNSIDLGTTSAISEVNNPNISTPSQNRIILDELDEGFDDIVVDRKVTEKQVDLNKSRDFKTLTVDDRIKTTNTAIAGWLAISLWAMLGLTIVWHGYSITELNGRFWNVSETVELSDAEAKMDKSLSAISDTAKTLYAVIAPIAATVTGFYFQSSSSSDDSPN